MNEDNKYENHEEWFKSFIASYIANNPGKDVKPSDFSLESYIQMRMVEVLDQINTTLQKQTPKSEDCGLTIKYSSEEPIVITGDNSFTMVDNDGNPMYDDRPIKAYKQFFMEDYPFFDEDTIFYDSESRYRLVKIEKDEENK